MRTGTIESIPKPARPPLQASRSVALPAAVPASLCIGLLNLMPDKPVTDRQFATLLSRCGRPVNLIRSLPPGYRPHTTSAEYLAIHYASWAEVEAGYLDGLIVTGAPLEHLPFEAVSYWDALTGILDWTREHSVALYTVCWAAQAALKHFHGIDRVVGTEKLSGVYTQTVCTPESDLVAGMGASFPTPVSRYGRIGRQAIGRIEGLEILAEDPVCGISLVDDPRHAATYMLNHPEYDAGTIACEYRRDLAAGKPVRLPAGYFPRDNVALRPAASWAPFGQRLLANWLDRLLARRTYR